MIPIKLSAVKPDFASILLQLQLYLQATGTWSDLQTSGTGETLLEMMSAVAALNQFAIESAARETTLTTAVRDSSVYAITRMLGVKVHRKSPASVDARITRTDAALSEAIQTFTQFDVGGKNFFNRQPLMFVQGSLQAAERLYYGIPNDVVDSRTFKLDYSLIVALNIKTGDEFKIMVNSGADNGTIKSVKYVGGNVGSNIFTLLSTEDPFTNLTPTTRLSLLRDVVRLYEGMVLEETFTSDGSAFQQYYLANNGFGVSDTDIEVRVMDETSGAYVSWSQTTDGLWVSGPYDKVFFDSTSGRGEAIIAFGDGVNGAAPKLGNTIKIKYAITSGASANTGMTSLPVALSTVNNIDGITVGVISGGADEKPASYYRNMAPVIFKARNRGVTPSDYRAVSLDYPGIISVSVQTQRDLAPDDLRYMNMVQICLLPAASNVYQLTSPEWDDFCDYMDKKKHAAVNIIRKNPTRQYAEVDLTLALKTQYVVSSVVPQVDSAVRALFIRQSDSLGRRISVSDIIRAAMAVAGVDYVVVNKCVLAGDTDAVVDLVPVDNTHFLELSVLVINTKYSEREIYV